MLPLLFFFLPLVTPLAQSYFRGLTVLRVLETRHFEIIYPRESEETARTLARFADGAYEEISARLGISVGRRIPVAITPHLDEFNSFMNSMPYPHILLLDTPMGPEWSSFDNSLERLFLHEMTHAVSLSTRGPVLDFFHRIFGGWVYPPAFNVPSFMTEGVAVSFESFEPGGGPGYGRANDPLARQKLRQENHEGKFLSPHQVSGVSDLSAAATGAWYEYGGLFSKYLEETYGMEKYAELWQALGRGFHFSFFFYNNGFYYYFKKIYGLSVPEAWENFRASLALEGLEDSAGMIVREGLPYKPKNAPSRITGMAAAGSRVFVLDRFTRQLFIYNGEEKKTELAIPMDSSAYDVAASPQGDRFLVSAYRYHNSRSEAVVTEYRSNGLPGRTWHDLYRGSFFRDGVVGIGSEGRRSRIVFRSGNPPGAKNSRNEEVLLEGGAELVFSNPRPLNDTWIAFTAARGGRRELGFYNYQTKQAYRGATDLPDDEERWKFMRYLQVSGGRLLFGYDHDDRMYKLALAEVSGLGEEGPGEAALTVVFTDRDFSGAVALPVLAGEGIYYSGSFFATDRLMRYPEGPRTLAGISAALRLLPWKESPPTAEAVGEGAAAGDGTSLASGAPESGLPPARLYLPFKYLNPLYLWFPFPLVRSDPDTLLSLDGGGIYSIMIDPSETNTVVLQAAMDGRFTMANFELTWANRTLGFPLTFSLADGVTAEANPYRALRLSLESSFSHSLGTQGLRAFWGLGFGFSQFYRGPGRAAYNWDFHSNSFKFMVHAGLGSLTIRPWETFGQGISVRAVGWGLSTNNRSGPQELYPRIDGYVQAAFEPFLPLRFSLYGAWDAYREGMNLQGASSQHVGPVFQAVSLGEYQDGTVNGLEWIAGGEAEVKLFSLNVQKGISHLYINRFFGTLAYRAALYNGRGFPSPQGNALGRDLRLPQSLVFRLGAGLSSAILTSSPLRVTAYLQTAVKLSNFGRDSAGFTDLIAISPSISVSF
ncbi:MAG: hypothetical protein LBQ46_11485 [Treponema sp.]|nr:hypothetical protein [Treponema sp.]